MQPNRLRPIVRWIHLCAAASTGVFVYSPWSTDAAFVAAMKFGVFPLLGVTGVVLWQQARLLPMREAGRWAVRGR
jgi:hypothetical protein